MLWKLIAPHLRPHKAALFFIFLGQLIQAFAGLWLPTLNADIIDFGVAKGDTNYILKTGALMLAVSLAQFAAAVVVTVYSARVAMQVGHDLRQQNFEHVHQLSPAQVRKFSAPSLITRTTNDTTQVQQVLFMILFVTILAPLMGIGALVMALQQDLQLSWIFVVLIPVLGLVFGLIMVKLGPEFSKLQERLDATNGVMRELLTGVRVIRAFDRGPFMSERFAVVNKLLYDTGMRIGALFTLMFPLLMLIIGCSSVAVMYFGARRVEDGMLIGALTAFLAYQMQIFMAVMMAAMIFMMVPRAVTCAKRLHEVNSTKPELADAPTAPTSVELQQITMEDVTYSFGAEPVVAQLNLAFPAGQMTGIIGSTGSGKTTIVSLLSRAMDPTAGKISLQFANQTTAALPEVPLAWWHQHIAVVPQKSYLFSGTIRSTIAAASRVDEELIWQCLAAAQASFITDLDAPVEPGGTNFSGGQRQRLAIARALYHGKINGAVLYLFDDSFSALDYATDAKLRAGLREFVGNKAAIVVVAQRVASLASCAQIAVLEHGRVVGFGSDQQLQQSCATYQEIVASQLQAESEVH